MTDAPYRAAHVSEVETPAPRQDGEAPWHAVRRQFGIASFGVSADVAERAGDVLTSFHDEIAGSGTRHEELFSVASGHAVFTVDDETVDAPAGTFVYVRDPALRLGATVRDLGKTVLAAGGDPGRPFEVSPWAEPYQHGG